jgi:protein transport protein SEC24
LYCCLGQPAYLFVIDVSAAAVAAGMLECVAAAIRANLDKLPGETRTQVGFVTYNSSVHMYNLRDTLRAPQQLVLPDLDDIFLPAPFDLLVNLHDSRHLV